MNRRIVTVTALGFASGLPLALSGGTMQAWLTEADVDIKTIGLFSMVGLPYALKFLWSPLLDRFQPGWPGRRRDWMLLCQLLLAVMFAIAGLGDFVDGALGVLGLVAFMIALFSATQDVAIDAYRAEVLGESERGFGAAVSVVGYRVAMLVSGAGALVMADHMGFQATYLLMSAILLVGVIASVFGPHVPSDIARPRSLKAAIQEPLTEYFTRDSALSLLLLIFLYKLGDAFAGTLTTTFLLRELGFSLTDVGAVNKGLGLFATIVGALYGGVLMVRLGLYRSLFLFAALQAVTNLGFYMLTLMPPSYVGMVSVIALENLSGGMGTAAFVALLMAICDRRYAATQFALLTAFASLGRIFAGRPAGEMIDYLGWGSFFLATFVIALPALVLLVKKRELIERLDTVTE